MKDIEEITGDVLDVTLRLHRASVPGPFVSAYEAVLAARLARRVSTFLVSTPSGCSYTSEE